MNHTAICPNIQEFIVEMGLNKSLSDKRAIESENNCEERLYKITGKRKKKPKHLDPRQVVKLLQGKSDTQRRVISVVITLSRVFSKVTASALTIARLAECSTKTVYRTLGELSEERLIKRFRRGREGRYDNSSITSVNPIFEHPLLKSRLWPLFDAYTYFKREAPRYLLLFLLFSSNVPLENSNITKSSNDTHVESDIYLKNNHPSKINYEKIPKLSPNINHATTSPAMESDMSDVQISNIILDKVTPMLHLTPRGQAFLSSFHDGALDHGLTGVPILGSSSTGGIPSGETPRDWDYRLFVNLCEYWTHRHKLPRYHDKTEALMKKYGCSSSDPFYHTAPIPRPLPPFLSSKASAKEEHQRSKQKEIAQNPLLDAEFAAAFEVIKKKEQNRTTSPRLRSASQPIFIQKETF